MKSKRERYQWTDYKTAKAEVFNTNKTQLRTARQPKPTNVGAEIHGLEDLDGQIGLDFTDDLDGVVEREMGVLRTHKRVNSAEQDYQVFPYSLEVSQHCIASSGHEG